MAGFYHTLQKKGLRIKWPFFATSHGKGVIDGLGGTEKDGVGCNVHQESVKCAQCSDLCKDHSTIL